jgi:hypothetical protein
MRTRTVVLAALLVLGSWVAPAAAEDGACASPTAAADSLAAVSSFDFAALAQTAEVAPPEAAADGDTLGQNAGEDLLDLTRLVDVASNSTCTQECSRNLDACRLGCGSDFGCRGRCLTWYRYCTASCPT